MFLATCSPLSLCISYLSSCQEVLTEVYTQLMLPLPSDLSSSPDRPLSPPDPSAVDGGEGEKGESSEEWTPVTSLEEPPAAPKQAELRMKRSEFVISYFIPRTCCVIFLCTADLLDTRTTRATGRSLSCTRKWRGRERDKNQSRNWRPLTLLEGLSALYNIRMLLAVRQLLLVSTRKAL